jgi:tape measure domain-containing protein
MAGDLNTRIIISARDDASKVFLTTADNLKTVGDAARKVSDSLGGAMSTEVVARKASELAGNLASLSRFSQAAGKDVQALGGHFKELAVQAGLPEKEFASLQSRMLKTQATKAAADSLRAVGEAAGLSSREVRELGQKMGISGESIRQATSHITKASGALDTFRGVLGAIGVSVGLSEAVQGIKSLSVGMFDAGKMAGQTQKAFEAINGSASGAGREFEFLRGVAGRLGQNFWDLTSSYKSFSAAAKESNFPLAETHKLFEATTKASASLGLSTDQTQRAFMAFQQMISKGTLSMEEVRGQLAEALPGAMGLFVKASGMAEDAFMQAVSSGEILATDILPKVADLMGQRYPGDVIKAVAAQNKFNEAWTDLKVNMANSGFLDSAATSLGAVAEAVSSPSVQASMESFGRNLGTLIEKLAKFVELASMRSVTDTFTQGAGLAKEGKINWDDFVAASFLDRQKMVDSVLYPSTRNVGKVAPDLVERALSMGGTSSAVSSAPPAVKYSATQSEKTLQGVSLSDKDALNKTWAEGLKKISSIQKLIDSGKLSTEDMNRALKDQGVIWNSIGKEQEQFEKAQDRDANKGAKRAVQTAKANLDSIKVINEAMGKALEAQDSFLGDEWAAQARRATTEHQKALDELQKKLVDYKGTEKELMAASLRYWADYEYGIKLGQIAFDKWAGSMAQWGDLQQQLGEATFDPSLVMAGSMTKLQEEHARALQAVQGDSEKTAMVMEIYAARETEIQRKGVRDRSDLKRQEIEARLGYEDSYGGYLKDRLALQYGLYKDAAAQQLEVWEKTADATIELFDGVMESFTWAMGQGFGDLLTGKLKTIEDYTQQLLAQLKQVFANWLTEMARIAANKYIVVPIMGQIMGTSGSLSLPGASGLNVQGGDGFSLTDAGKYLGYGKDAYNLLGGAGGMGIDALSATSTNAFTSSLANGGSIQMANVSASNATAASSSTLSSIAGPAALAATGGYMVGGMVRPDDPLASYVGAGAGLAGGAIAGMAGLGMLASTGIGLLAAIPAAIITGLAQPNTVKSEWSVPNASKSAIMIAGGENTNAAYGVIKQTSSGAFGSSSTSHKSIFGIASPEMAAQQDAAWAAATKGLDGFTKAVGVSSDQLTNAKSSFNFPAIPIPDGMDAEVYRNVANAEAEHTLAQLGMLDAIKAVAKSGEAYIDTLTRLDSTFSTMENLAISTGFGLEQVAAGMDRIVAADYASRLMEAAGGADAFGAALARLNAYGYTAQEQMERSLTGAATATGRAIAEVGDATVTIENFWPRFRAAMESGMDPDRMAAWVTASARMEQWEQVKAAWQQRDIEALQTQTSTLQAQISVIQQVSSAWKGFGDQMVRLKQSLLMDANLSTLSPLEKMNTAKSRLDSLTAEANNKSTDHLADIDQATKDYLTSALDYYGASADYFALFDATTATIDQLQVLAGSQVSAADQQVASLNFQIEQNNAQITALNTINSGLGDVVNAVNNVSSAIGGAIQSANAAQRSVSVPQWAGSAVAVDSTAAASPYAVPAETDGTANYRAWIEAMGWSVPAFATGGTTGGGWFVAGDDPLSSRSGELMYSSAPVRVFSNRQSRAMLSGGGRGGDTAALEAKLDAVGSVLVDILNVLQDGGGAGEKLDEIKRVMKSQGFVRAGA